MSESLHAKFSASAAARWLSCPGSMVLTAGLPDKGSSYARQGTAEHAVLEWCIQHPGLTATDYCERIGTTVLVDGHSIDVASGDATHTVNTALAAIREIAAGAELLLAETRVNYSKWLGVPHDDAWGTADCIAIRGNELIVMDYKSGRGEEVDAEDNEQLKLYALGALTAYGDIADITHARLVILQPRIKSAPSEWRIDIDDLVAWGIGRARSGAASVINAERGAGKDIGWEQIYLHPGEKACRWCKAKATCPALREYVALTVQGAIEAPMSVDEFADLTPVKVNTDTSDAYLAAAMAKADLIEDWLKAVRAEVERRLLAGQPVPGYKLVQGKQGNRAWSDKAEAEKLLREVFRLPIEKAYDLSLISPTSAEKLAKAGDIGPRQWGKAEALIVRSPGRPSVAPASDKRPALDVTPVTDEFNTLATDPADIA